MALASGLKADFMMQHWRSAHALRHWMVFLLKGTVTTSLVVWLCLRFDFVHALPLLQRAHAGYVVSALVLMLVISGLSAQRQQLLLRTLHIALPFKKLWLVTLISNLFQYSLPGIGGDEAAKLYYVMKATRRPVEPILSACLDGGLGLAAWLSVPLLVIPFRPADHHLREAGGIIYGLLLVCLLVAVCLGLILKKYPMLVLSMRFPARVAAMLQTLRLSLALCGQQKGLLLKTFGIAVVSNLLHILIYYTLAVALDIEGSLVDFAFVLPMVILAALLPISFGGLGVHEWTFLALFTALGMPRQAALSISLLRLVAKSAMLLLGAVLYLMQEKLDRG